MKQIVTKVKKKTTNGYTAAVPIGAKAQNVILNNGTVLQDVIDVLSTGQAGHMDLTQAQYNALSDQEKYNGTVYFVSDSTESGAITNASVIGYNNTNVQSALDSISINKINYSDVVDDLTSDSTSLPLSAAQGKELKDQIDALTPRVTTLETNTSPKSVSLTATAGTNCGYVTINQAYVSAGVLYVKFSVRPIAGLTSATANVDFTISGITPAIKPDWRIGFGVIGTVHYDAWVADASGTIRCRRMDGNAWSSDSTTVIFSGVIPLAS